VRDVQVIEHSKPPLKDVLGIFIASGSHPFDAA